MLRGHFCVVAAIVLFSACGDSSPASPSGTSAGTATITVSISPTPLSAPADGGSLVWNVIYQEVGGVGARLDRDEMTVIDAAGGKAAEKNGFWKGGGCSACPTDLRIGASASMSFSGLTATYLGPPRPGTFKYTLFYTDDRNNARSTTVTVPVVQ